MEVPAIVENKDSPNVIALHLRITAPEQSSLLVTGNAIQSARQPLNMSRSTYVSNRLSASVAGSRTRSASTGRDKKSDLRARHWAFLFENLQHAVDELYQTCEMDENISECKEVMLVLENYTRDFHNLAEWFRLKWEYENTPPPQRPNSLTWEIRKSSPGKIFRKNCQLNFDSSVCRELIFELDKASKTNDLTAVSATNVKVDSPISNIPKSIPECVDNNKPISSDNNKPNSVDCGCQTDDETQLKKTPQIGRKLIVGATSYSKKSLPNFSIRTAPEKNTPIPLVLPLRRLSGCVSPRKSVPGRNIAAPVFVPGKKINVTSKTSPVSPTPETKETVGSTKLLISRSQSDSVFETSPTLCKNKFNGKKYASADCVNNDTKEEACQKIPVTDLMRVINEGEVVVLEGKANIPKTDDATVRRVLPVVDVNVSSSLDKSLRNVSSLSDCQPGVKEMTLSNENQKMIQKPVLPAQSVPSKPVASEIPETVPNPTSVSSVDVVTPPCGDAENAVPKITALEKPSPEDKKTAFGVDLYKKIELKKMPLRANIASRSVGRPWDPKPQRLIMTERKTNFATRAPASRVVNQKYVKNVGVPKMVADKVDSRGVDKALAAPSVTKAKFSVPANEVHATPVNYSNITKLSSQESVRSSDPPKYSNMVRSKTSIDMRSRTRATPPSRVPPRIATENRETPSRSRRSSKDSDGWETVISRSRRSIPNSLNVKDKAKQSFDMSKRFHEPTPSASLPTLAVVDVKEKLPENSKSDKTKNRNRNNSQGSSNIKECANTQSEIDERPIISSTAMFTTIPSERKKSNEKDSKKTKIAGKRKSSKELDKPVDSSLSNAESLRKSKELYEKEISLQKEIHDLQNTDTDVDDSDATDIDPEIVELCKKKSGAPNERRALLEAKYSHVLSNMSWAEQVETLDKLEELLERDPSGKSLRFAKNFTSLKQFEDLVARWPGRALELHQKLSSPSRKRISPDSTILQHKARQAKAKLNREQLLLDKSAKIRELFNKVAEVKAMQMTLAEERRKSLDRKLKRAEENRNLHLKNIQEKAHDEAKKQKEIAFINELEAQNKRHDFFALCQEQEDRLQSILGERQRRQEEKAAKDAAVEERRKAIEAERQEKIEELQEKMRKREERIDREFQEKERERIKVAREKARDREDRLLALQAAQIANAEELQKKIQQKQEDSARRHEESIELRRQRAIEIGTPRLTPYQINKLCSVCNVVIDSEVFLLSHLKGSGHQEAVKKYREQFEANVKFSECSIITNAPAEVLNEKKSREKERQKTLRKRCKKIRQRLNSRSDKYLNNANEKDHSRKIDTPDKRRIFKSIKDIEKLFSAQGTGMWPNNAVSQLERNLFDIMRMLEKGGKENLQAFREFDGFVMVSKIYERALDLPKNMSPYLPLKCFVLASNVCIHACSKNADNCVHFLLSNRIVQIVEFLLNRLNLIMPNSDDRNGMVVYKADSVADVLMNLCSIILLNLTQLTLSDHQRTTYPYDDIEHHLQDVVSYIVCAGIVDKLAVYCSSVHDKKSADSFFLQHSIELLTRLVEARKGRITDKEDNTQLMATLKATELVGAVSMLYAMLLHQDSMSNGAPAKVTVLQTDVVNVIIATLRLFSRVCELNLEFFQNILGAEGISLQVRHIISYLLKYCVQNSGYTDLLHQVIEFIGFFAIHHHDNQMILQSGSTPTVLQQLSSLPFEYFSNPNLVRILFPTLLACCVDNVQNRLILDQEMSFQLLEDFRNLPDSKNIPLIKLLR